MTFVAGFLLLISPSLFAQNGGFAGTSSRMGFNARGLAMSNAMSANTSEGVYAYYNPAQAALHSDFKQTDFTVGALQFDRVFQTAGIHLQLPPSAGLSFNILRTGVKEIDGRTQSGYPTGLFDASEYQFGSNFGIRMSDKLNAGIGVKFSLASFHQQLDNPVSVGVDLGLLYHAGNDVNFAFAVKDLFANYTWNSQELYGLDQAQNVINTFPTRLIFGVAYQHDVFNISADYEFQVYQSETESKSVIISEGVPVIITNRETVSTSASQLRLGASWLAHERFTLRGGWQLPDMSDTQSWGLSSGFSIHLPFDVFSPSIDYAFLVEPYRVSTMHIFSLRLNL